MYLSSQVLSPASDLASYLGDGDCNHDSDCEGSLICGNNNCNKEVIIVKLFFEYFLTIFTILNEREACGIQKMTVVQGSVLWRHVIMGKGLVLLIMIVIKMTFILVGKQTATANILSQRF